MNLKDRLAERGIVCAHIIDDAFDSVPTYALTPEAAQHVLELVEDAHLKIISDILGLPKVGGDSKVDEDKIRTSLQTVEEIQKLFLRRKEVPENAAKALFDPFDKDMEGKRSQLKPLIDLLTANGVTCCCFGADYTAQNTDEPQLFFVDLKLKEGTLDVLRHEDAVRAYTVLKSVHPGCKPFVFLMSSLTLQLGEKREQFRHDADLFQSEFEDIDKAAFTNGDELSRVLASYTRAMPQLATLRDKMNDVQVAVAEATDSVMRELRALDLADYFVLYHNTTSIEKVNLGSYVVEMLLEFLAHEVEGRDRIWNLASALDGLNVQELPRARFGLTRAAAQLYSANMLHSQAMLLAEDKMKRGPSNGYFFTGDIFFDAQSLNLPVPTKAFAIVTPACDMVRLEQLKGRSILLCEGSVREMEPGSTLIAKDSLPLVVMPHPRVAQNYVVIEWHRKKLHVWDDKDRAKFVNPEECSFVRAGRLRPVYALQLQDAVTSDLSRVGTQKPPSALIPHGMKCFVSDGKNWHEIYADASLDAAALSDVENGKKKSTTYIFSDPAMHRTLVKLAAWLSANPAVEMKASFEKILGDDARAMLRGFHQKLSEKAQDVTMYPFDGKWTDNDGKFVAVVRGVACPSPYAQVAGGQNFRRDLQARVVFRLEKPTVPDDDGVDADAVAAVQ